MRLDGTHEECEELIAQVDAALGYPRGYTQADIDSGLVVRTRGGTYPPIERIRTETASRVEPVITADGTDHPTLRRAGFEISDEAPRRIVARQRVLRLLNRGSRARLIDVPGIGPARADAIIAARPVGSRWRDIEDLRDAGMPLAVMQAVRDYVLARMGDEDDDTDAVMAQKATR